MDSRESFLRALRSSGKNRYKRFTGSPLRYAGGKSLAVGFIVERLPRGVSRLVSPFLGGGSVEVACAVECGIEVVAYDVFDILANYWREQISRPQQLAEKIGRWSPTAENYCLVKERLKKHWRGDRALSPERLAAHYWFNHNLSYGPGFLGWMSKIYQDERRFRNLLGRVRDFHALNFSVEGKDFRESIPEHRGDFLYCDPPYYLDGDSKMFRGIYPQRNFPIHHRGFDHGALRDLLCCHGGGFILSYNDCSVVRDWYRDFEIVEIGWQYTLGQGETRIGFNRVNGGRDHVKKSHELLILG